jgi:site-specific DNA recombinase
MRPVFNQLIEDLKIGVFNAILTWAPDRMSRNAGDLGSLVDLMDQGKLLQIKTYSQVFTNNPNEKFLLMILCSQAKLENDNRGLNVKRGIRNKCELGWRPCMPPLGYHSRVIDGVKDIVIDPVRGPLIKELFELIALAGTSGRSARKMLYKDKNFKTRTGKDITLSMVYRLLRNPFYFGQFEYPVGSGTWYKGKHESLIPKEIFDRVQERLEVPEKAKWRSKNFAFTRTIHCGECGTIIVAEEKYRDLLDGTKRKHVYYHCGRPKNDRECHQPYIEEEELISQLIEIVDTVKLDANEMGKKIKQEFDRYKTFGTLILNDHSEQMTKFNQKIDISTFAKHILRMGSSDEKREILNLMKSKLILQDRRISVN